MPLSQIIVTSRYLKSGSARSVTKRKNYTKYIATRETVEKREQNQYDPNAATTEKQKRDAITRSANRCASLSTANCAG